MRAIRIEEFGGPEVMRLVELPDPEPGDGEVVVDVARAGVNFADLHASRNEYVAEQELPLTPGAEIAGRTADGRRVAAILRTGGYAERVAVPADALVDVPDAVSDEQAAAVLLQGLTAHVAVHRCGRVQPGETVVVESAAGGTGTVAVQLAKGAGARVIALASDEDKRELTLRLGAGAAVDPGADDLGAAILAANGGDQVDVVLQMSGGPAFDAELRVLAPFGRMVVVGISSREQNEVRTGHLLRHSRTVTGFWIYHLLPHREEVAAIVTDLFDAVAAGELEAVVGEVYPLSEARRAHEDLAGRRTTGKLLLDPAR
ncbi:MAG: NADPH:quinone reductase [Solirubrobacterales bacterium]|nr:NADPH:quinone reductase [Solirubrobacterales bacterium]